jgi:ribosome recycling factor
VRNVRRDGTDQVKKSSELSEDDQKIWSDEIQELTNVSIKKIDEVLEQKQVEIMQV